MATPELANPLSLIYTVMFASKGSPVTKSGLKSNVKKNISNRQHHIGHQHLTFTRVLPVVLATALVTTDDASDLLPVLVLHHRAFAHRRGRSRR